MAVYVVHGKLIRHKFYSIFMPYWSRLGPNQVSTSWEAERSTGTLLTPGGLHCFKPHFMSLRRLPVPNCAPRTPLRAYRYAVIGLRHAWHIARAVAGLTLMALRTIFLLFGPVSNRLQSSWFSQPANAVQYAWWHPQNHAAPLAHCYI